MIDAKPYINLRFDKIDGFIRFYDATRYLALCGNEKYDIVYNIARYLIGVRRGITYIISYNYSRNKVDSYDSLKNNNFSQFYNNY